MTRSDQAGVRKRHYWRNLFLFTAGAFLAAAVVTCYLVIPFVYASALAHPQRKPVCCFTPGDLGLTFLDVSFRNASGLLLGGWYIPSHNRAAVIIAHGLGGNRVDTLLPAATLARRGYGVLLLDLAGHGDSEGQAATFGGADIEAAAAYLQTLDGIDPERIGVMGQSLGAMVSIQAAASTQAIKAVVADGAGPTGFEDEPTPTTLDGWFKLPFYAVEYKVWKWQGVSAPLAMVQAIARITPRPVLLIASGQNKSEVALQRRFFAAAGEPRSLWIIPEAQHIQGWQLRPQEYEERIAAFFDQALANISP